MVSLFRGNRGQSVVEFALVLPLLLLVLFGITELGRAIMTKNVLTSATREGARLAIVTEPDEAAVIARVREVCSAAGINGVNVSVTKPHPTTGSITVTATSTFVFLPGEGIFNHFGGAHFPGRIQIGAASVMRHETL